MKSFSNKEVSEIKQVNEVDKKKFAMYIEQSDGEYVESLSSIWPTGNYLLNTERSSCVDTNGAEVKGILSYNDGMIYLNSKKTVFCNVYFDSGSICSLASDSTITEGLEGAKYNCKVDPNKDAYTFYLLDNNTDGTSDLIMNANINASGEAVIPGVTSDTGMVAWYNKGGNGGGPVTAMTYLYNATKSWTNVEPLNYEYYDRETQGITTIGIGYQSFVSTNGIAVITTGGSTGIQETIGSASEPLRSRMPIYSSDASITELTSRFDASYLYDNIDTANMISTPYGYWTLSSRYVSAGTAWVVSFHSSVYYSNIGITNHNGVRPVITVNLD